MTLVYARALQSIIRAMRQILKDLYGVIRMITELISQISLGSCSFRIS